jgi:regulator of protease activity HflC (stomatin/prohibitin superfamily)
MMDFLVDYIPASWSWILAGIAAGIVVIASMTVVEQGDMGIVERFGRYCRVLRPGLSFILPWIDHKFNVSVQKQAVKMKFAAITQDQANVHFSTMLVYRVANGEEETLKRAAYAFVDADQFLMALQRTVEGSIRQLVANTRQAAVLGLRGEISQHVKAHMDEVMMEWGYTVDDVQVTDIGFDQVVTESMARVVAAQNLLAAAENEGRAQLVKRTKDAEAEAAFKTIGAEAEKKAAALRGEGVALFRLNMTAGMAEAATKLERTGLDARMLLFMEYVDGLRHMAQHGTGKIIFVNASAGAPQDLLAMLDPLARERETVTR